METSVTCKRTEFQSFGQNPADIYNYRHFKHSDFADACLYTEDGVKFDVHRIVLAHRSLYFRILFCSEFIDGTKVLLRGMNSETLKQILHYIYFGNIHLTDQNVLEIFIASDYFLMDVLVAECRSFAIETMSVQNCFSLLEIALRFETLDILNDCYRYVCTHFEEAIFKSAAILRDLPLCCLRHFLKDRSLNVGSENTVWNVIVQWTENDLTERSKHVPELLQYISMADLDETLAKEILFSPIVQNNKFCDEFRIEQSGSFLADSSIELSYFRTKLQSSTFMDTPRTPQTLHVIAQYCIETMSNSCFVELYLTYDDELDIWRKITKIHCYPDFLVRVDSRIFLFDTWDSKNYVFNIVTNSWSAIHPMSVSRCGYCVVSLDGSIYALGGASSNFEETDTMERYDPATNEWSRMSLMLPMILSEVVVMNGSIYAIGDMGDEPYLTMMIQKYSTESNTWSSLVAPIPFRHNFAAVVFHAHLYIIGGEGFNVSSTNAVEYNPDENSWRSLPDLPFAYILPRALVFRDSLYVCESHSECRVKKHPPVGWDRDGKMWQIIDESCPPFHNIDLYHFLSVDDVQTVRDITRLNRLPETKWEKSDFA